MPTTKKRIKVSLSEDALKKLEWLIEKEKKQTGKNRVYVCDLFEKYIDQDYKIKKAFN